jgi:hypothetical protein
VIILNQNEARDLPVLLLDSADHVTAKVGIAEGSVTVKISKNLGALTNFTLTGKWTEIGQGLYKIAFAAGDLDTIGYFGYFVTATGCDQYSGMMYISEDINYLKQKESGKWEIKNNQLIYYDADGVTPLKVFNLYGKDGNPTSDNPYKRVPV